MVIFRTMCGMNLCDGGAWVRVGSVEGRWSGKGGPGERRCESGVRVSAYFRFCGWSDYCFP